MDSEIIYRYFPNLTSWQKNKFDALAEIYASWNDKINVISRKDIEHLYEHHVLYSLSIAKFIQFTPGTRILDVGTGGGFPGIPLAILFPEASFFLADSIRKKIKVVREISTSLELKNVVSEAERAENIKLKFDFVVSRAVTRFPQIVTWVQKNVDREQKNSYPNGIIYLKGEDTAEEQEIFGSRLSIIAIERYFNEEFFKTKKLLYLKPSI
jgi:16S rRNA (guanine527-N7)-methyltransferase